MTYDSQETLEKRRESLERELARVDSRIALLENIPEEPVFEDGEPTVVWFRRRYATKGREYTFAAVRIFSGQWYMSGGSAGSTPVFASWANLYQWIQEFGPQEIWTATSWEQA